MNETFTPSKNTLQNAAISEQEYADLYAQSIQDPDKFWAAQAERLTWVKKPTKIKNTSFNEPVSIKWFEDGILNACYNCVDRHLPEKKDTVALIWEGDEPGDDKKNHLRRDER